MAAFFTLFKRARIHFFGFCILALMSLGTLLAERGGLVGLCIHFQFYLALGWGVWAIWLAVERKKIIRQWRHLGLLCGFWAAAWHGQLWAGPLIDQPPAVSFQSAGSVRVMWANVQRRILHLENLLPVIAEFQPDLLALAEVRASPALDSLEDEFPHQIQDLAAGIVFLSRYPLENPRIIPVRDSRPMLTADVQTPAGPLPWIVTHALVPPGEGHERTFEKVAELVAGLDTCLVMGDWNTTPWSPQYRLLTQAALLNDVSQGYGAWPTWKSKRLPLVRLPIDHIFWKGSLRVVSFEIGASFGSDHSPLFAEIELGILSGNSK